MTPAAKIRRPLTPPHTSPPKVGLTLAVLLFYFIIFLICLPPLKLLQRGRVERIWHAIMGADSIYCLVGREGPLSYKLSPNRISMRTLVRMRPTFTLMGELSAVNPVYTGWCLRVGGWVFFFPYDVIAGKWRLCVR